MQSVDALRPSAWVRARFNALNQEDSPVALLKSAEDALLKASRGRGIRAYNIRSAAETHLVGLLLRPDCSFEERFERNGNEEIERRQLPEVRALNWSEAVAWVSALASEEAKRFYAADVMNGQGRGGGRGR